MDLFSSSSPSSSLPESINTHIEKLAEKIEQAKLLHKETKKKFIVFVNEHNARNIEKIMNKKEKEALGMLRELWTASKEHFEAKDFEYFFKMNEYHEILNKKMTRWSAPWQIYLQKAIAFRSRITTLMVFGMMVRRAHTKSLTNSDAIAAEELNEVPDKMRKLFAMVA